MILQDEYYNLLGRSSV